MLPPCLAVCFFTVSHGGSISAFKQVPKPTLISALKKKLRREYNLRSVNLRCSKACKPNSNSNAYLPIAQIIRPVYPDMEGYVSGMNVRWIGLSVIQMGGGHSYLEQKIDYAAGYTNICRPGMYVSPRIPLAFVHANDNTTAEQAAIHLKGAIRISEKPV